MAYVSPFMKVLVVLSLQNVWNFLSNKRSYFGVWKMYACWQTSNEKLSSFLAYIVSVYINENPNIESQFWLESLFDLSSSLILSFLCRNFRFLAVSLIFTKLQHKFLQSFVKIMVKFLGLFSSAQKFAFDGNWTETFLASELDPLSLDQPDIFILLELS